MDANSFFDNVSHGFASLNIANLESVYADSEGTTLPFSFEGPVEIARVGEGQGLIISAFEDYINSNGDAAVFEGYLKRVDHDSFDLELIDFKRGNIDKHFYTLQPNIVSSFSVDGVIEFKDELVDMVLKFDNEHK